MISKMQKEEFLLNGFLQVRAAFDQAVAHECAAFVLGQIDNPALDIDRADGYVHIKESFSAGPFRKIWNDKIESCVDVILGEDNYQAITDWGWWPISFPGRAPRERVVPVEGWHIDGEGYQKLDDPEYAVICLALFTDIDDWGGGTFVEVGSHREVIHYMARSDTRGQGVLHQDINDYMQSRLRGDVVEMTGRAGDIVLMNPYVWHCRGYNYSDRVRIICNSRCVMKRRLNLRTPQNVVEQAIAQAMRE